jgi:glutamyl-tRNA synthetase
MVAFLRDDTVTFDDGSWQKHVAKHGERAAAMLDATVERLGSCEWTAPAIEAALLDAASAAGFVNAEGNPQMAKAQGPVRVATTGRGVGPPLYESLEVLGRGRTLDRLRSARSRL